ncbi:ankyrin repeat domain-containing protein [Streptomyces sp. NPDC091292]|uniref:ankyrin repeat domain-containing protein n=1 Tax=Streptomyces sp. NPDC091292 TaxID=3365991 RepID=UPI003826DE72
MGDQLVEAVYQGDERGLARVLESGVEVDSAGDDGLTALYVASVQGEAALVRLLLAAGADPDRLSADADLPLCGAACGGYAEVVRALLGAGARPDLREEHGFTALTWAVRQGHGETVDALLDGGADPDLPGPDGVPPLVAAARRGGPASVRALLAHGARDRAAALAEARDWRDRDVEAELRAGLVEAYGPDKETRTTRTRHADGTETIEVEVLRDGTPAAGNNQENGHAAIVALLETSGTGRPEPSI